MNKEQQIEEEVKFKTYEEVEKYVIDQIDIREADKEYCEL